MENSPIIRSPHQSSQHNWPLYWVPGPRCQSPVTPYVHPNFCNKSIWICTKFPHYIILCGLIVDKSALVYIMSWQGMYTIHHGIRISLIQHVRFHVITSLIAKWVEIKLNLINFNLSNRPSRGAATTLQWRHSGRDSVSNHQPHDFFSTVYSDADQRKY